MTVELKVTAKGQVTLRREVLEHLGVSPGQSVEVMLRPGGRVELVRVGQRHDVSQARACLRRPGQRPVSLEEMQAAIEAGGDR